MAARSEACERTPYASNLSRGVIALFGGGLHNDAMGVTFSYDRVRGSHDDALKIRRAVSLLETIIVLFIIGLMMALLFPAMQAAPPCVGLSMRKQFEST